MAYVLVDVKPEFTPSPSLVLILKGPQHMFYSNSKEIILNYHPSYLDHCTKTKQLQKSKLWPTVLIFNFFNPIALRKAKIVYNFGLSECNRVKNP